MKKILSLLILAIILIATIMLASCDVAKVILGVFDLIEEDNTNINIGDINIGGSNDKEHIHTVGFIPGFEATCSIKGLTEGQYCTSCEKTLVKQMEIPLRAHTEVIIPAVEPTCTSMGLTQGIRCCVCNKTLVEQKPISMLDHTYTDENDESCNYCEFIRPVKCTHKESEILSGYPATCTSTGLTNGSKCKTCAIILIEQEIIPLQKHTEAINPAIEATCNSVGLTEGKYCSVCNIVLVEQIIIPIQPHTASDWIVDVEPTATTKGSKHIECTACRAIIKIETIGKLGSQGLWLELNADKESYSVIGIGTCEDEDIVIPESYNGLPVTTIGDEAFASYSYIDSIVIGDSIISIGEYAFAYCESLKYIEFGNSITSIGDGAFYSCVSLMNIKIPNSVIRIGNAAFSECISLTNVVMGDSVTNIGNSAFNHCKALTSIQMSNSVTSIGDSAFAHCTSLTKIVIPNSVTSVGSAVFNGCKALVSIEIPNSVTSIGNTAFADCTSLTKIIIPDSVTRISDYLFSGCSSITIYCEATSKPSGWSANWNHSNKPVIWGYKHE